MRREPQKGDHRASRDPLLELLAGHQNDYVSPFAQIPIGDIRRAFDSLADDYPPILSLDQAAALAGVAPSTLKRHVSEGRYKDCVSRGKPLRFWRDRFVQEAMRDK